jgi:CheY-like chemotaxis protein
MNREVAAALLRTAGHRVICVASGALAVQSAADNDFDVILMDVRMPLMDGLEATRRIRILGGVRSQVPIVALTAQAFSQQIEACKKVGMDSHLTKPFDHSELLRVVQDAAGPMSSLPVRTPSTIRLRNTEPKPETAVAI